MLGTAWGTVGQAFFSMPRLRISALNVWILGKGLWMPPRFARMESLGCRAVCHPSDRSTTVELRWLSLRFAKCKTVNETDYAFEARCESIFCCWEAQVVTIEAALTKTACRGRQDVQTDVLYHGLSSLPMHCGGKPNQRPRVYHGLVFPHWILWCYKKRPLETPECQKPALTVPFVPL